MRHLAKKIFYRLFDLPAAMMGLLFLPLLKLTRRLGVEHFPLQSGLFRRLGIFPIRDHYYEPRFVYPAGFDADKSRLVPISLDLAAQLSELQNLRFVEELKDLPLDAGADPNRFYINNPNFGAGDAELYYLLVRNKKPRKIIEIGSGFSTLLCLEAVKKNAAGGHPCELVCIEPFEMPFLNRQPSITLIREKVETVDTGLFKSLDENDILFIDSSHIIRPGNDVLFIFFQILPVLNKGVLIHIHDIFTPLHYPHAWLAQKMRFWNEQYLLEAFLYNNPAFAILFAANHLTKNAFAQTRAVLVHLEPASEPSSFWMEKC